MDINANVAQLKAQVAPPPVKPAEKAPPVAADKAESVDTNTNKLLTVKSVDSRDNVSLRVDPVANADKTVKLTVKNETNNNLALETKVTDQALSKVTSAISEMRDVLVGIVKNYPPFPPESLERKALLMSYAGIRKELLKMEVPPPPPPIYEKVVHQWQELFQMEKVPRSINLAAELDSAAPDSALKTRIDELKTLYDGVTTVQADIKRSLLEN